MMTPLSTKSLVNSALKEWLQPSTVLEYELLLDRDNYLPGTFEWIREHKAFQLWYIYHSSPQLWIHGFPGTGKSVLAAKIVSILQENDQIICANFFCTLTEPSKRVASSIILTIIYQLALQSPHILKCANELRLQGFSLTQLPILVWRHLVVNNIVGLTERFYIVIDGLDMCEADERKALMGIITSTKRNANISWLVVSRYLPDIAYSLVGPNFVLHPADTNGDVMAYIDYCVNRSSLSNSPQVKEKLVEALQKGAIESFLWVKMMVQALEENRSIEGVLAALHSLPLGLEELYHHVLESLLHVLDEKHIRVISTVFGWLAYASSPLTFTELNKAINLSLPDVGQSLDLRVVLQENCGGLISITGSGAVQFVHETVREYVCSNHNRSFAVIPRDMHSIISKTCLSYLSSNIFANPTSSKRFRSFDTAHLGGTYPLLLYAALYWADHFDSAEAEHNPKLLEQLCTFISSRNLLTTIEVAVAVMGCNSLHRWIVRLSRLEARLRNTRHSEMLSRFIVDLTRLVRYYGPMLNEYPGEIFYIVDECFPRKSHFWKNFGHEQVFLATGQSDDWDPLIAAFNIVHINCIAVSPDGYLVASDSAGISIISWRSWMEIGRIEVPGSLVVAIAFNNAGDILAILCQDGTLKLMSTGTWEITKELSGIVNLPTVVREWDQTLFWSL